LAAGEDDLMSRPGIQPGLFLSAADLLPFVVQSREDSTSDSMQILAAGVRVNPDDWRLRQREWNSNGAKRTEGEQQHPDSSQR
jgi:hypothetical protein